jgi:hypothetical protein
MFQLTVELCTLNRQLPDMNTGENTTNAIHTTLTIITKSRRLIAENNK